MRTTSKAALLTVAGILAASQTFAAIIVNGNFEAGNTGFSSGYTYDPSAGGLATGGEGGAGAGKYTVGTNPQFSHPSFVVMGDHTTGTGNMLIVNGSTVPNKVVWSGTFDAPHLIPGQSYNFSAWVANVYPDSPASINFQFGGANLGTISPTGVGVWQPFTATFTATTSSSSIADLNLLAFGNDFAIDDVSLATVPVPEPTTMVAGALLLLPFCASTMRRLRKA